MRVSDSLSWIYFLYGMSYTSTSISLSTMRKSGEIAFSLSFIRILSIMQLHIIWICYIKCYYWFKAYRMGNGRKSKIEAVERASEEESRVCVCMCVWNAFKFVHPCSDWSTTYGAMLFTTQKRHTEIWQIFCKKIISIVNVQQSNRNISMSLCIYSIHPHTHMLYDNIRAW